MKRRNMSMLYLFFSMLLGTLVFSACNSGVGDYSDVVVMVPNNVSIVADIDLQTLGSSVTSEQFKNSAFYSIASDKSDDDILQIICQDSIKTGICYDEVLVYAISKKQIGMAVMLDDAVQFEEMLKVLSPSFDCLMAVNDGVKSCVMEDSSLLLLWDNNKALFLTGTDMSSGLAIFTQEKSQSIIENADFRAFYADKKEIAVWMDMERYWVVFGDIPQFKQGMAFPIIASQKELYAGMYSSYNVEFLDGEIVASGKITPRSKAQELSKKYYKEYPSKALLSAIPGNSYLLFSASLQLTDILEMYKELPPFADLLNDSTSADLMASFDGDIVLSIRDFATGPLPIPNAVIGLSVKDHALLDALLKMEGVQKVDKEGYTALVVQIFQMFVAQKNNILLISTDENVIKSFVSGKDLEDNLTNSKHTKVSESTFYSYINLDIEQYPVAITALLQKEVGQDLSTLNKIMCLEDLTSWYEYGSCESKMVLSLKDKKKNSLTALFEMMNAIVEM